MQPNPTSPTDCLMSQAGPRVAIVVPVFRHSVLLSEAIESALAQQAAFAIQVVVVNDGCPHMETEAVCADYALSYPQRVTYLRKPNGGLSSARNHGVRYALQKWPSLEAVYLLDADNRLRTIAIAKAMSLMEATGCGWVYPSLDMFGLRRTADFGGAYSHLVQTAMNVCEAGSLISRKVFEAGVLFDEEMRLGFEDWDFFLSAGSKGFLGRNLDDFGFLYRKRPESMLADSSRDQDEIKSGMLRKHKSLMNPKNLLRLEQMESPRYAIYLVDEKRYLLTVDPLCPGTVLTEAEFDRLLWSSWTSRSRNHAPPILVVTSRHGLDVLQRMRLLHWAFWRMEDGLRTQPVSSLSYRAMDGARLSVQESVGQAGSHLDAAMLMVSPACLGEVIHDEHSTWIDSLALATCEPPVFSLSLTCPSHVGDARELARSAAVTALLAQLHLFRSSPFRMAANRPWDWREPAVPWRNAAHDIVRMRFGGAPAFPKLNTDRRQIGFLLPLVDFGGVEKVTHSMAAAFRERGWTPHLVVLNRRDALLSPGNLAVYETVSFLCDDTVEDYVNAHSYQGTPLSNWSQSDRHGRALGLLHWFDVVVNCHGAAVSGLMAQLRRIDIKTVVSLHLSDLTPTGRPVGNTYVALAHEHAYDMFITCSHRLAHWCHGMGVPQDKITPVPNAGGYELATDLAQSIRTERSKRRRVGKPVKALFLGRLDRQKGLDRLADVIRTCSSTAVPVQWRLVGKAVLEDGSGGLPAEIQALVEPPIHAAEDLNDLYRWADVLILPSYYEGLPLTIVEAMRLGVVVIATDVGAVSEVVIDGKTGVLLRTEEAASECVRALATLAADPDLMVRYSLAAIENMKGRSWGGAIQALAAWLEAAPARLLVPPLGNQSNNQPDVQPE